MGITDILKTDKAFLKWEEVLKRFEQESQIAKKILEKNQYKFVAIHMTNFFPEKGVIKTHHAALFHNPFHERPLRETIHFALNNVVAPTGEGDKWGGEKYCIVIPFKYLINRVVIPNPTDIVIFGNFKLANGCYIISREEDYHPGQQDPGAAKIITIPNNKIVYEIAPYFIQKLGYSYRKQAKKIYESEFWLTDLKELEKISLRTGFSIDRAHFWTFFHFHELNFSHVAFPIYNCNLALKNKNNTKNPGLLPLYVGSEISFARHMIKNEIGGGAAYHNLPFSRNEIKAHIVELINELKKIMEEYDEYFRHRERPFYNIPECTEAYKRIEHTCNELMGILKILDKKVSAFPKNIFEIIDQFSKKYNKLVNKRMDYFMHDFRKLFNSIFPHKVLEF